MNSNNNNENNNNIDLDNIDYLINYLQKIQNQEITLNDHINNVFNEFENKINCDYQKKLKKNNNNSYKLVQNLNDELSKLNNI